LIKRAATSVAIACFLAFTPALAADARAQAWPTRPVTMICPFPPGISTDLLARAVAASLGERLGQQFVMENRPGANGNIGTAVAAKAAPDGYTFLVATLGPAVANKYMYKNMPYDPEQAFTPVVLVGYSSLIIVGSPKMPAANLKELVVHAKANPGKLNAATVGHGSQAHITLELINKLAGISMTHVPYRIATQALPDLISGDLQVGFNYIPTFVPAVQQGTIRGLAVTSAKRLPDLPNVPTVDESGFPGFEASGWTALLAPAGTPREIIEKLNAGVNAYLNSEEGKAQLRKLVITPMGGSIEAAKAHLDRERTKWVPTIKEANITLQ
jgi:tripartite-type tricarboxylate transporter receptor subunit TctC